MQSVTPVFKQVGYPFLSSLITGSFYFSEDGLMWFSTSEGLVSFDGTEVLHYSSEEQANQLNLNRIFAFAEDSAHNFYLGTNDGLVYFNRQTNIFTQVLLNDRGLKKEETFWIAALFIDRQGFLFCGTGSRGLFIYNPKTKENFHLNLDSSKPEDWMNRTYNTVSTIAAHFSDQSKLWIGAFDGIYSFDKQKKTFKKNFRLINPSIDWLGKTYTFCDVQKMEVLNDSIIWFNSWTKGFCEYNTAKGTVYGYLKLEKSKKGNFNSGYIIPAFARVSDRYFFIATKTNNSGLFDIISKTFYPVHISENPGKIDIITNSQTDRSGNIWLINNGKLFTSIPFYSRLQSINTSKQSGTDLIMNELKGIYFDQGDHKYYAAVRHSTGIYVFDSSFQLLQLIQCPLYNNYYTHNETCTDKITKDGSGRFWVTGRETYIKLPGQTKFDYIRKIFPSLKWIENKGEFYTMLTLKSGDVVMQSYENDTYIINHKTLTTDTIKLPKAGSKPGYTINRSQLLYDSIRSYLYVGNDEVMIRYNLLTKAIRLLQANQVYSAGKRNHPLLEFSIDGNGRIWAFQMNYGIRIIDPEKLTCIDSFRIGERGLKTEAYIHFANGGKDFMIFKCINGIVLYNFRNGQSLLFDHTNGLELPVPVSMQVCNNYMVLGQLNSAEFFNTSLFSKNNFILQPRVNLVKADTSILYLRELDNHFKKIVLTHNQNNFQISFSAPEFVFPERIEYAYRLAGSEQDWHYTNYYKKEASYTHLQPGEYVFKLKAQMQGGNWQARAEEYVIIISPAWWQTNWFKILALVLSIGTVILVFRLRVQSIRRKEKQKLAHEKELLELEAKALRAQMNPHFVFNSLNSIKSLIQQHEEEKSVTYLTTFSKLIRNLFNSADKKNISLYDEIETCKLYMQLEAMRFDAAFSFTVNIDAGIDLKSIEVPALIIQPFIENAIWHGIVPRNSGGKVSLNVLRNDSIIEVVIDDNGIGREASAHTKSVSGLAHQSKGVNLTQSRLELNNLLQQHHSELEIIDKKDGNGQATGTTVIIKLKEELS